jgi:hypothetical protein
MFGLNTHYETYATLAANLVLSSGHVAEHEAAGTGNFEGGNKGEEQPPSHSVYGFTTLEPS